MSNSLTDNEKHRGLSDVEMADMVIANPYHYLRLFPDDHSPIN